ncbi:MAG: serine/threonine-protein kinase, partial [Myxococcota bacterium]
MVDPSVGPGDVLEGKYRLLRRVGRGGMGVLFEAEHLELPTKVAIKLSLRAQTAEQLARFRREAAVVVGIRSEHVCRVYDVGSTAAEEPYIVMELLPGEDLGQHLERRGPLDANTAVNYLLQACEGLAEAHLEGVVHRDLKPSNLFLTRRRDGSPLVKVLDFGIAKAGHEGGPHASLTSEEAIFGSPTYMSPEQLTKTKDVDGRTDIWSLGVTLYELLSGRVPFAAPSTAEVVVEILNKEPPPIAARGLSAELTAILRHCLQKFPDQRFVHLGALAAALRPWAHGEGALCAERVVRMFQAAPRAVIDSGTPPAEAGA